MLAYDQNAMQLQHNAYYTYNSIDPQSNCSFLRTSSRNTFLDFFLAQDLDGVFGEDVAKTGPDGGCCDEVSVIISIEQKQ